MAEGAARRSPLAWWGRQPLRRRLAIVAVAVVAVLLGVVGAHTAARLEGWIADRVEPSELATFLRPHTRVEKPAGAGPFPTALLFSGCDGPMDNLDRWASALVEAGWAAILVDSHTPRGYQDYELWRLVCAGQLMPGPERAGDVLVSIAEATTLDFVDADRLALVGFSHGGWSIMELLALDSKGRLPINLSRRPEALEGRGLSGVGAVVLVYPWCGLVNRARHEGWAQEAPVLFILAELDIIAPAFECELAASLLQRQGRDVETIMFDGATHGFDQEHRSAVSPLVFDPEATREAITRGIEFMNEAVGHEPIGETAGG